MSPNFNFLDYIAVQNVLSLYCVAVDTKDFQLFSEVFQTDARAKYPFAAELLSGVPEIADVLAARLEPVATQHSLTTQNVNFYPNGRKCSVMTYFTAVHFGKGSWTGSSLTMYGKFVDELVKVSSSNWRVSQRQCLVMGMEGEVEILQDQ